MEHFSQAESEQNADTIYAFGCTTVRYERGGPIAGIGIVLNGHYYILEGEEKVTQFAADLMAAMQTWQAEKTRLGG